MVQQLLAASPFSKLGPLALADPSMVRRVVRYQEEVRETADVPYLSNIQLDQWVPDYYGRQLSTSERKKFRKERSEHKFPPFGMVIEHVVCFWVAHGIAGSVGIDSVSRLMVELLSFQSIFGREAAFS